MKKIIPYLIGWVILALLFIANYYVFSHFLKLNYYQWFIEQGALISTITGLVYFLRDEVTRESKDIGLISTHPLDFLGAHFQLLGLLFIALGASLKGIRITKFHLLIDFIITILIVFPLVIILVLWCLVIIPCQYLLYFICGAPSRVFHTSATTTSVEATTPSTKDGESPQKESFVIDIKTKPFQFTNAIAAIVLFILSQILF
jgi:hypothetical protein